MYDRPNAIKGRYVKIPNMLIFVAEPVNHEVIDPWRLFNIIYIMRTNVRSDEIRGFVGIVVLIPMAFKSAFSCADTMNVSL